MTEPLPRLTSIVTVHRGRHLAFREICYSDPRNADSKAYECATCKKAVEGPPGAVHAI